MAAVWRHQLECACFSFFPVHNSFPLQPVELRAFPERSAPSTTTVSTSFIQPESFRNHSPLDYSQCTPGTGTSAPAPSPTSGLPRLGGVNTAGYDFSVVSVILRPSDQF